MAFQQIQSLKIAAQQIASQITQMQRLNHQNHYNSNTNKDNRFNINPKEARTCLNTNQNNNRNEYINSHNGNNGFKGDKQLTANNVYYTNINNNVRYTNINKTNKLFLTQLFEEYQSSNANDFILQVNSNKIAIKVTPRNKYQCLYQQHKHTKNVNFNKNNGRAVPLVIQNKRLMLQKHNVKNNFLNQNKNKLLPHQHQHQHQHLRLNQLHNDNQKQNYFLNLPQKISINGQTNQQEDNQLFIFKVKDHKSNRKNSLLNALHNYQRKSTSRSHSNSRTKKGLSHSPKSTQRKIKSQIRISPINSKLILQNFDTNRRTNFTNQPSQQSLQVQYSHFNNQTNSQQNRFTLTSQQKNLINNNEYFQEKINHVNKGNNFSFDQEQHFLQNNRSQPFLQKTKLDSNHQGRSAQLQQLHTIEEVQQSIRSIQIPQNQFFDEDLSKKINNHFEQIKQNMMKQLTIRSKNGPAGIDQASMESIIQELQVAADSIVKKYQTSFDSKNHNLKKSDKIQKNKNSFNLPNDPLMPDICGSDQNYIEQVEVHERNKKIVDLTPNINDLEKLFDNLDNLQSKDSKYFQQNKSKDFNEFLKNGLITNEKLNSFQCKDKNGYGHGIELKIVNGSFAQFQTKQNESETVFVFNKNQNKDKLQTLIEPLKYGECSKGSSSISSIKSNIQQKIQNQNIKQQSSESNPNKDSMKAQVQSLNRYTFLKHATKEKSQTIDVGFNLKVNDKNSIQQNHKNVYTYREKQLDESQYKITQNHKENLQVYNVSYNLKVLNSHNKNQQKSIDKNFQKSIKEFHQRKSQVQVFRLSPLKFRRKQQVVEQMVKIKMIQKQSESFFR